MPCARWDGGRLRLPPKLDDGSLTLKAPTRTTIDLFASLVCLLAGRPLDKLTACCTLFASPQVGLADPPPKFPLKHGTSAGKWGRGRVAVPADGVPTAWIWILGAEVAWSGARTVSRATGAPWNDEVLRVTVAAGLRLYVLYEVQ